MNIVKLLLFFSVILQASFIQAVAVPDLVINYKDAKMVDHEGFVYQDTTVSLEYDSALLAFLPVGLWMEAGIKLQEEFYTVMLNNMAKPLRVQQTAQVIVKIANHERVSDEELQFVISGLDLSFTIPYRPFRTRLDIVNYSSKPSYKRLRLHVIDKPQNDITYKTYEVAKVDVMHKDGFNFFYLFAKKGKLLIINNILIPPVIFCEYNGLFWLYKIDFSKRRVDLYEQQFMYSPKEGRLGYREGDFFRKLTKKPQKIINSNIGKFLLIYADYLKADL